MACAPITRGSSTLISFWTPTIIFYLMLISRASRIVLDGQNLWERSKTSIAEKRGDIGDGTGSGGETLAKHMNIQLRV